jgi:ketosteroid isomerase-like protein
MPGVSFPGARDTARAMSQENVKRVRQTVDAINARDLETALKVAHPDIEWRTLDAFPDAGTYHGPEGVVAFFQAWLDTFRNFHLDLENCSPVDENRVLARLRVSGIGAESGAAVESPQFFQLIEFRDGLMIRARMFPTESEALEAAGLKG